MSASAKRSYRPETQLVHAGILRSQFGETSEALFLTQGYVYDSALSAEKRFKNEEPGYQYSRFSNPTVNMFEQRMAALEGAQAARATATGMAAVTTALMGQVQGGRSYRVVESAVRLLPLRRRGAPASLRRGVDAGRRHRPRPMAQGSAAEHQDLLSRDPDQSGAGRARHQGDRRDRPRGGRDAGRRQRVLDAAVPAAARTRRRLRGLFRHQAHRRSGPLPRRRHPRLRKIHPGPHPQADPPDRPVAVAVQCLGSAQGPGDALRARAPADRHGGDGRGRARRASRRSRA